MSSLRQTNSILFGLTLVLFMMMTNGVNVGFAQSSALDNPLVGVAMKGMYVDQNKTRMIPHYLLPIISMKVSS